MKPTMGRPLEHNWKALLKEKDASDLSLAEFCESKELSYTNASREFTKLEKEQAKELLERTQRILAKSLPEMARGLIELSRDDDKGIQLKAISTAMDRAGLSPQAVNISVSNTQNVSILAMPIFANNASNAIERLLGAKTIDADTD